MPYPFYCPQRHQLQAELTAIGQVAQCPVCGTYFLVPPPDFGAVTTRNAEGLSGLWQAAETAASLPVAIAVEPRPASGYPGAREAPAPPGPPPTTQPPRSPPPTFATPADAVFAGLARPPLPPGEGRGKGGWKVPSPTPSPSAAMPPAADEKPAIDLGFDPLAGHPRSGSAALPFELPDQVASTASEDTALPAPLEPPDSFLAGPAPPAPVSPTEFPAPSTAADEMPIAPQSGAGLPAMATETDGSDLIASVPAAVPSVTHPVPSPLPEGEREPAETPPLPKVLHIRCPAGHVLKAPSELLGKLGRCPACKQSFQLRYEDSLQFQRRTEKILLRDQREAGREWLAWTFGVAFLLFIALVGAVLLLAH